MDSQDSWSSEEAAKDISDRWMIYFMVCRFPISLDVRTLVVEPRSYPRPSPDFSQTRGSGAHDHGIVPYLDQSRLKLLLDASQQGKETEAAIRLETSP